MRELYLMSKEKWAVLIWIVNNGKTWNNLIDSLFIICLKEVLSKCNFINIKIDTTIRETRTEFHNETQVKNGIYYYKYSHTKCLENIVNGCTFS